MTGREEEEIRALWRAAHQKVLLDETWLSSLLDRRPPLPHVAPGPIERARPGDLPGAWLAPGRRVEWEEVQDVPSFYGRQPELALLSQWVMRERCRVVSVLGMGGIGKSALAVTFMHQVADHFEVVFFRHKSGSSWPRSWHACAMCTRGEAMWRSTCSRCSLGSANGRTMRRAMGQRTW